MAGLDGVRALAVMGIIAFHSGLSSVPGGFYGVDAFFVVSGYLITSLLLGEFNATGHIQLQRFWARRARRLLPALVVLVAVVGLVLNVAPHLLATPHIVGDVLAALFYFSNWYSIHGGVSYFSLAAQPSPLLHTWSLAIEEQFYLVWPLVVLAVLKVGAGRRMPWSRMAAPDPQSTRRRRLHLLFWLASLGALASAVWMGHLAPNGFTARTYYGTDTRAQGLLVGAALATGLILWRERTRTVGFERLAKVVGLAGIVGTGVLWATTSEYSTDAFRGGFLVAGLCAAMVVFGAVVAPKGPAVTLLEIPPLPALGRISYGIYLWYWPVLLVISGSRLHWGVYPLFLTRTAVTVVLAGLSAHFVEEPIRRGALHPRQILVAVPAALAATLGLVFTATLVTASATPALGPSVAAASIGGPALAPTSAPASASASGNVSHPALADSSATLSGPPVKVLLVGDSMAGSLGVGLGDDAARYNVRIVNEGIPGCSLSMTSSEIRVLGYTVPPGLPCAAISGANSDGNSGGGTPDSLLAQWRRWIDAYNPDVVVYLARGETFDQEFGSQWEHLGQSSFDSYVESRYRQAIKVLSSRGATVVLSTSPYYDSGASPSGSPWPEDTPGRVDIDNQLIREAADVPAGTGTGQAYVFDLNALISPHGQFAPDVDGISARCGDGVHITPAGGQLIGLHLLPVLAQLGRAHQLASPGGAWVGDLPPSTPSWYANLPC